MPNRMNVGEIADCGQKWSKQHIFGYPIRLCTAKSSPKNAFQKIPPRSFDSTRNFMKGLTIGFVVCVYMEGEKELKVHNDQQI